MGERTDTRGAVDAEPDVTVLGDKWFRSVDTDAGTNVDVVRPVVLGEGSLSLRSGASCVPHSRKDGAERIRLGIDYASPVLLECALKQGVMRLDHVCVLASQTP